MNKKSQSIVAYLVVAALLCVSLSACTQKDAEGNDVVSGIDPNQYYHIDEDRQYSAEIPAAPVLAERSFDDYAVIPYTGSVNSELTVQYTINNTTNEAVFAENAFERIYPASMTKIMTALLVLEDCNLDDEVTIKEDIVLSDAEAVRIGLMAGDKITVRDLLYTLLLCSANDSAIALAQHHSGSVEAFVEDMNRRAVELGATHTHFVNPNGLHDPEHYTTGYDLYLIFKELIQHDDFRKISGTSEYTYTLTDASGTAAEYTIGASNEFIYGSTPVPEGFKVLAGKTGTTSEAGSCLILLVQDEKGDEYIMIAAGAGSHARLYQLMSEQIDAIRGE